MQFFQELFLLWLGKLVEQSLNEGSHSCLSHLDYRRLQLFRPFFIEPAANVFAELHHLGTGHQQRKTNGDPYQKYRGECCQNGGGSNATS